MKRYLIGYFIILSLCAFANDKASNDQSVDVFKYECRSAQCTEPVLQVGDMQKELQSLGVTILSVARGFDGRKHYSGKNEACNRMLSRINIFKVAQNDLQRTLNAGFVLCSELESNGGRCSSSPYADYQAVDQPPGVVSVYKSAGRLQCESDSGVDVDTMEQELIDKKIIVYKKYQATDGMLHPLKCEALSADINVYVIERESLSAAESIGFQECVRLKAQGGACYPEIDSYDDDCL